MRIKDIIERFRNELREMYSQEEIENFIFFSMQEYLGYTRRHLQLKSGEELEPAKQERFLAILSELKAFKPIQHILGNTEFYGLKIRVNEHTLIPRPETEELVEEILSAARKSETEVFNILDIGTGSGCIAIALKKHLPEANVSAIDVSEEALLLAKQNAILNKTLINFLQADILRLEKERNEIGGSFDIIVSNPPYVCESEKEKMSRNVVDYEPHAALFVRDENPLLFYNAISDFAIKNLSPCGKLWFEINETMGKEVKKLLESKGFKNVQVKKDMSGKDRMAEAGKQ